MMEERQSLPMEMSRPEGAVSPLWQARQRSWVTNRFRGGRPVPGVTAASGHGRTGQHQQENEQESYRAHAHHPSKKPPSNQSQSR